jgi:CHAD domain-containing protein
MPVSELPGNFVPETTTKLLERLAFQVNTTLHSHHAEPVHDLRVAIRRFTQALVTFRGALPGREIKRIRRKLKNLMDPAGAVRDADVLLKMLAKRDLPGVPELKKQIQEHRKAAVPVLVAALERWVARRSSSKWRSALLACPVQNPVQPGLRRAARKFLEHGDAAAAENASGADLHLLRIEAKKFRYTLELFETAWGDPVRQWLEQLKPVQSLLGDIHDSFMAREMAGRFGASQEIDAWLKRRQRRKTREFRRLWEERFPAPDHRLRIDALRRPTPKPAVRAAGGPVAVPRPA